MNNKYILIVVEGKLDKMVIGEFLLEVLEESLIKLDLDIHVTYGDILPKGYSNKPEQLISKELSKFLDTSKLQKEDIVYIAQICDTDGSYIKSDLFELNENHNYYDNDYCYMDRISKVYFSNSLSADDIKKRWTRKRNVQNALKNVSKVDNIPYRLYYNSIHLEHLLSDRLDIIDNDEKRDFADCFLDENTLETFLTLLENKKLSDEFQDSWNILQCKEDPFKSCSNMNILMYDLTHLDEIL